jgi:cyclophilin family peptidyl-prolyl cis-trans isomerase
MARTNVPDSATSQFFINLEDNVAGGKKADGSATINNDYNPAQSGKSGYAVFGKVIAGSASVTALAAVPLIAASDGVPQNRTLIYWAQQVK